MRNALLWIPTVRRYQLHHTARPPFRPSEKEMNHF